VEFLLRPAAATSCSWRMNTPHRAGGAIRSPEMRDGVDLDREQTVGIAAACENRSELRQRTPALGHAIESAIKAPGSPATQISCQVPGQITRICSLPADERRGSAVATSHRPTPAYENPAPFYDSLSGKLIVLGASTVTGPETDAGPGPDRMRHPSANPHQRSFHLALLRTGVPQRANVANTKFVRARNQVAQRRRGQGSNHARPSGEGAWARRASLVSTPCLIATSKLPLNSLIQAHPRSRGVTSTSTDRCAHKCDGVDRQQRLAVGPPMIAALGPGSPRLIWDTGDAQYPKQGTAGVQTRQAPRPAPGFRTGKTCKRTGAACHEAHKHGKKSIL